MMPPSVKEKSVTSFPDVSLSALFLAYHKVELQAAITSLSAFHTMNT